MKDFDTTIRNISNTLRLQYPNDTIDLLFIRMAHLGIVNVNIEYDKNTSKNKLDIEWKITNCDKLNDIYLKLINYNMLIIPNMFI